MANLWIKYFRNKRADSELAIGVLSKPVKTWLLLCKVTLPKPRLLIEHTLPYGTEMLGNVRGVTFEVHRRFCPFQEI